MMSKRRQYRYSVLDLQYICCRRLALGMTQDCHHVLEYSILCGWAGVRCVSDELDILFSVYDRTCVPAFFLRQLLSARMLYCLYSYYQYLAQVSGAFPAADEGRARSFIVKRRQRGLLLSFVAMVFVSLANKVFQKVTLLATDNSLYARRLVIFTVIQQTTRGLVYVAGQTWSCPS